MAEWYEYGHGGVTPHIHAYSGGDCHLKVAGGDRYDLVKDHVRVTQAKLNEAFDRVRADYPNDNSLVRIALIAKMKDLVRGVALHHSDKRT
jgi:hypothetical protein